MRLDLTEARVQVSNINLSHLPLTLFQALTKGNRIKSKHIRFV